MIEKKIIAGDGLELALRDYRIENPKGIFHIIHGASEHKKRYDEFCKFLASSGYAAVISDTRGHGESINNSYPIGHVDSLDQIIGDMKIIRKYIEDEYPGAVSYTHLDVYKRQDYILSGLVREVPELLPGMQ